MLVREAFQGRTCALNIEVYLRLPGPSWSWGEGLALTNPRINHPRRRILPSADSFMSASVARLSGTCFPLARARKGSQGEPPGKSRRRIEEAIGAAAAAPVGFGMCGDWEPAASRI